MTLNGSPRSEAPRRGGIVFTNTWTVFSDDFRVCQFLLWVMCLVNFEKSHHLKLEVIRCFHAKSVKYHANIKSTQYDSKIRS